MKIDTDILIQLPKQEKYKSYAGESTIVIRPEHVRLSQVPFHHAHAGVVETVSFLGERYEVTLQIGKNMKRLFAYSSERLTLGQAIYFTIVSDSIHFINQIGGLSHETA
ncbi:hypothetical protein JCM9152_1329 [Halalkalibacter hemicellulosilyticusJCM 9152]|uniref:Transport-associated OB type 2 domain-containing protein n=1 Tax=Halalkalibacter hemicellulosilyticusJCM 9152 TaxID=1236971 RepID=W4QD36_9BACI|nr:TOBE domain-containing protein [Halalkalibacter hemicellulosilyticus]GAE29940.1 hypothetical protein JCM9152_1329 [Halalkalibacter hemicellulosilyticusJCM 9152]